MIEALERRVSLRKAQLRWWLAGAVCLAACLLGLFLWFKGHESSSPRMPPVKQISGNYCLVKPGERHPHCDGIAGEITDPILSAMKSSKPSEAQPENIN